MRVNESELKEDEMVACAFCETVSNETSMIMEAYAKFLINGGFAKGGYYFICPECNEKPSFSLDDLRDGMAKMIAEWRGLA